MNGRVIKMHFRFRCVLYDFLWSNGWWPSEIFQSDLAGVVVVVVIVIVWASFADVIQLFLRKYLCMQAMLNSVCDRKLFGRCGMLALFFVSAFFTLHFSSILIKTACFYPFSIKYYILHYNSVTVTLWNEISWITVSCTQLRLVTVVKYTAKMHTIDTA